MMDSMLAHPGTIRVDHVPPLGIGRRLHAALNTLNQTDIFGLQRMIDEIDRFLFASVTSAVSKKKSNSS